MDYFVFAIPLLVAITLHFSDFQIPVAISILVALISAIPFIFLAKWPQRISNHNDRRYLLKQKKHNVIGVIGSIAKYDTGETEPVKIIDGYSQRFGSFDIYQHYHIEHEKVFDGYEAIVYIPDNQGRYFENSYIVLRTLPSTFLNKMDHFPRIDKTNMIERKLTYVEDIDGEKYYIPDPNSTEEVYDDEDLEM